MTTRQLLRNGPISWFALLATILLAQQGCDAEQPREPPEGGATTRSSCARYDAIAEELGCTPLAHGCEPPPRACEELGVAWLDCVARDLTQCMCETDDGALNCEGSFKPDEGPARCRAQYRRFDHCLEEQGGDDEIDVAAEASPGTGAEGG
jgi:hypothetical protein